MKAETCGPIEADARQRLISYIVKKYKLPPQLTIRLEENGFIGDSCYRKVRFFSVASAQFFDLSATLAPDQVFLVTGLDDSRADPVLVQKRVEAARYDDLTRGDPPSAGPSNARAVVVVFSDFECPYCKGAVPVLKDALNWETHDVRVVFRNYPLSFHPWALRAALSGRCAAEQSSADFWKIHDFFFDKQGEITVGNVDEKARGFLGGIPDFDLGRYNACLSDDGARRAIQADIDLGNANGVAGTPSVYVNGRKFAGELTVERLRDFIAGIRQEATGTINQQTDTR
jgi:protein-disulfide isomerase